MKKLIVLIGLFAMLSTFQPTETYSKTSITKQGGDGIFWFELYDKTKRVVDGENITVNCTGDGGLPCPDGGLSIAQGGVDPSYTVAMRDYAYDQIENNVSSGSYTSNFMIGSTQYYRWVTWTDTALPVGGGHEAHVEIFIETAAP